MNNNSYLGYNPNTKKYEFDSLSCQNDICCEVNFTLIDGVVNFYWDGIYERFCKQNFEKALYKFIPSNIKFRKDMYEQICSYIQFAKAEGLIQKVIADGSKSRYIAFQNGILDLDTNQLLSFTKNIYIQNKLPVSYNPDADISFVDNALSIWANHNEEKKLLLQELIGTAITINRKLDKCFILLGPHDNGKSVFLETVQLLVGDDNYSNLQLKDLKKETYLSALYDKLVNCGDDIDYCTVKDTGLFKKIVSQNKVIAKNLYEMPFSFTPRATMLFSANTLPNIVDRTGDINKRIIVLEFNNNLSVGSKDRCDDFIEVMSSPENLEALALVAVAGLQRLRQNGFQYTVQYNHFHQETDEDNPVLFYLNNIISTDELIDKPVADAYKNYTKWCEAEAETPVTKKMFGLMVQSEYKLKSETVSYTKNGRSTATRVYKKGM
jgi:putative DNA primase/helicase